MIERCASRGGGGCGVKQVDVISECNQNAKATITMTSKNEEVMEHQHVLAARFGGRSVRGSLRGGEMLFEQHKKEAINQLNQMISRKSFTCVLFVAILLLNSLVPVTSSVMDRFITNESLKLLADHHHYRAALQAPDFELAADSSTDDQGDADELGKILAHSTNIWSDTDNLNNLNANNDHNNLIKTHQGQNQTQQQQHWQPLVEPAFDNDPSRQTTNNGSISNNNNWPIVNSLGERSHRASIVQTEYGDHAESSELENQFSAMLGTNNNNYNSNSSNNNYNQSAEVTLNGYNAASKVTTSTTTTTTSGDNMADQVGSSQTPLGSGRREEHTQDAENTKQMQPNQQSRINSTEPNRQQQQQQRRLESQNNRIRPTIKKRRKFHQKNKLKQSQSSTGQKTHGRDKERNNLTSEGHSTMISYVSQQKQSGQDEARFMNLQALQEQQQQQQQEQQPFISSLKLAQAGGQGLNSLQLPTYNRNLLSLSTKQSADNEASGSNALFAFSPQQHNYQMPASLGGGSSNLGPSSIGTSLNYAPMINVTAPRPFDTRWAPINQSMATEMTGGKQQSFGQQAQFIGTDLRGPFELEQLQATASNLRSETEMVQQTLASKLNGASAGSQAGEASKMVAPGKGDALVDNLLSGEGEADDELADYDSDEPPSSSSNIATETSVSDRNKHENQSDAASVSKPDHERPGGQTQAEDKGKQFVHHLHDDGLGQPTAKSNNQSVSNEEGQNIGSTTINASNEQQQRQQPPHQMPDATNLNKIVMRSPGVTMGNDELLVGPFKSEAEAPATITLAGVIYQKSGASSALIRAGSARHLLKATTQDSSIGHYGGQEQQVVVSGGAGQQQQSHLNHLQPISATGTDQLAALGDLPPLSQSSSSIQNNLSALQQASPLYFYQTKGTSGGGSSSASNPPASSVQFMQQVSPSVSLNGIGATLSNSNGQSLLSDQQQAALLRFSPFLGGLKSSSGSASIPSASSAIMSSLTGSGIGSQFGLLPQITGEQLSLSSSNSKPTTATSSGLTDKNQLGKGRLAVQVSPGANTLYSSSSSLLPQFDQHYDRLIMNQLIESEASTGLGSSGSSFKRLPGGTTIWTIGGARSPSLEMAPSSLSAAQQQSLGDGEQNQASESKAHNHHQAAGGPIVIVQKDVKPVKYHLLRAYLKLRRLLRPFEATYVFPSDHGAGGTSIGIGRSLASASSIFMRRRHFGPRHAPASA